jgi:hypothetical protein
MDDVMPKLGVVKRPSSSLLTSTKTNTTDSKKEGWPISFRHLGRKGGYELTLYASSQGARKKWLEHIGEQQEKLRARGDFYNKTILSDNFFSTTNRVNCVAPFGEYLYSFLHQLLIGNRWRQKAHLWHGFWYLRF